MGGEGAEMQGRELGRGGEQPERDNGACSHMHDTTADWSINVGGYSRIEFCMPPR